MRNFFSSPSNFLKTRKIQKISAVTCWRFRLKDSITRSYSIKEKKGDWKWRINVDAKVVTIDNEDKSFFRMKEKEKKKLLETEDVVA